MTILELYIRALNGNIFDWIKSEKILIAGEDFC